MADAFTPERKMDTLRAELSRVTAERDEAVGLLGPLALISSEGVIAPNDVNHVRIVTCGDYFHDAAAFLSRMEGRKDG